jgi:hypothetical protein
MNKEINSKQKANEKFKENGLEKERNGGTKVIWIHKNYENIN